MVKQKNKEYSGPPELNIKMTSLLIVLVASNCCLLAMSFPALLQHHLPQQGPGWDLQRNGCYTLHTACMGCPAPSLGTTRYNCSNLINNLKSIDTHYDAELEYRQFDIWDPGSTSPLYTKASTDPWVSRSTRNKIAHITNGNRGQRGKGVTCIYWNKGPSLLCNKMQDIEEIIETHKPHILGLGEANFRHDHDEQDVQLQGYTLHLDSSVHNPDLGMARVVVYTHKILRVKRREDLEDPTVAAVWLECGLPNQRSFLVCAGYRQWRLLGQPDNTSATLPAQLARWTVFLDNWEKALQEDKEVIVAMDANIDHLTWRMQDSLPQYSSSVRLKSLIDLLFTRIIPLGVTQLVTGATRMERGQPRTGLDHIYTNKVEKLSMVQTFFTGTSDHKLLKVVRFTKSFKHLPRYIKKRSYRDFNEEAFIELVATCGLEEVVACTSVEEAAEVFTNKLTVVLDNLAPIKKFQTRAHYAPWLSKETKLLKAQREAAHKKAAETDKQEDWREFRKLRNQVTARSREDRRKWEGQKLDLEKNNPSGIWKTVKGWLGWGTSGTPSQIFWNGGMVTSPAGLAVAMNRFFIDKVKGLRSNIPLPTEDPARKLREAMSNIQCQFRIKYVKEEEVWKTIKDLKNSSATGVDYLDTKTIKMVADIITPALTHIINLSIKTSTFPAMWKWAKVIPLLKAGNADSILPKNYRPVALLPILSKILEKVVFRQLVKYLEENNLVHPNLHGSRAGHDTSTALLQLYDKWVDELEDDKMVGVLICDQSAAFDLCDHRILLEKLEIMGLQTSALNWIRSYLSDRKQSCYVDGELSPALNLPDCGVPQGSIGGPLLWLCFTSDQPDVIHEHPVDGQDVHRGCQTHAGEAQGPNGSSNCGELVGYVDDGAFSFAHSDPSVLSRVLNQKYNQLEQWMNNNRLVINSNKTHMMVIGSRKVAQRRAEVSIKAGEHIIRPTETEKLLGGHIHQSLKWNHHISESHSSLLKQLTSRSNGLKRIARNANFNTKLMIANGAVHSKLVYLITLWGNAQQYLLQALQRQQLIAARTVCGPQAWRWSRRRILQKVGWLSVRQLVEYHTILQAHKTMTTGLPRPLHVSLTIAHPYITRSTTSGDIRVRDGTSMSTFKYRAMVSYNRVPSNIKEGNIQTIKRKLKQWVLKSIPVDWG